MDLFRERETFEELHQHSSRSSFCSLNFMQIKTTKELEAARDAEDERIMEIVSLLKEREKRKVMRQLKNGEIDFDPKIGKLVYTDTKEEFVFDGLSDLDSDEEDDD